MASASPEQRRRVCVTGCTGYVGSWLLRSLLHKGYHVHATARDTGKALQLLSSSLEGNDRLRIFRADLGEEGSFDEAVNGCSALFHVAASMDFDIPAPKDYSTHHLEEHVRSNVVEPAVRGTINVLQACVRAGSIRRVIFTSSISTLTAMDEKLAGRRKLLIDESCIRRIDEVWNTKPVGWVRRIYVLSKLLTEEAAFKFAKEKGIHLLSIILPTVAGPFLTPSVPTSIRFLLSPITGDPKLLSLLVSVHSRFGSIPLAYIQDVCDAHIFLMETPVANGRYLCSGGSYPMSQLAQLLSLEYHPISSADRLSKELDASNPSVVSSKRLTDLGFEFKHDVRDIIKESISYCIDHGFLEHPAKCNNS